MLTNVLEAKRLSLEQIVTFYKMRWGIEVEFRGLKQTLDGAKLRCRNSDRTLAELNWSIMAMTVAELFALKQQLSQHLFESIRPQYQPARRPKNTLANTMRWVDTA